jgi:hypothetical protein
MIFFIFQLKQGLGHEAGCAAVVTKSYSVIKSRFETKSYFMTKSRFVTKSLVLKSCGYGTLQKKCSFEAQRLFKRNGL